MPANCAICARTALPGQTLLLMVSLVEGILYAAAACHQQQPWRACCAWCACPMWPGKRAISSGCMHPYAMSMPWTFRLSSSIPGCR